MKKILNKNEILFINVFSDIEIKFHTYPANYQALMPIKLYESMYLEKPKNRFLPGYGQIKEKTKKVIF